MRVGIVLEFGSIDQQMLCCCSTESSASHFTLGMTAVQQLPVALGGTALLGVCFACLGCSLGCDLIPRSRPTPAVEGFVTFVTFVELLQSLSVILELSELQHVPQGSATGLTLRINHGCCAASSAQMGGCCHITMYLAQMDRPPLA
jgi:hypothetical protein